MYAFPTCIPPTRWKHLRSTHQYIITALLRQNDFPDALKILSNKNEGWNGSRQELAKSLHEFVKQEFAPRVIDKNNRYYDDDGGCRRY